MDSILRPRIVSGPCQVVQVSDIEPSAEGQRQAEVELFAPVAEDFAKKWLDSEQKVFAARVHAAVVGLEIFPNFQDAEFVHKGKSPRAQMSLPATVTKINEGIDTGELSKCLVPLDAILGRIILTDPEEEITGPDKDAIIQQIKEVYPNIADCYDPHTGTFSLKSCDMIARLRSSGISAQDMERFLFNIRSPEHIGKITERLEFKPPFKPCYHQNDSAIVGFPGFAHPEYLGIMGDSPQAALLTRAIFPRSNPQYYDPRFLTRLKIRETTCLNEIALPLAFYRTERPVISGYTGKYGDNFEKDVESRAKLDMEVITSFPATEGVFQMLERAEGTRKATIVKDQQDFQQLMAGDERLIKCFEPVVIRSVVDVLARAEDPSLPEFTEALDPASYPELRILKDMPETESGVLFCRYFPDTDVLRRLYPHAHKLRAIVFEAAMFQVAEGVLEHDYNYYKLEECSFFDAQKFVALKGFHQHFPNIKIIWHHYGQKRNLVFANHFETDQAGNVISSSPLAIFAKPEVVRYIKNPEETLGVSYCGSSSVKPGMDPALIERIDAEERSFTKMYCDYARAKGKMPMGINGGGPDVMERNGRHLQELGAISVASTCALGKAGQTRHRNFDAVINFANESTAFTLREGLILSAPITHIYPGGIGSLEEFLFVLTENKIGIAQKRIIFVGREYWKGQMQQMLECARHGNIKAHMMKLVFIADTPEEARSILDRLDNDADFLSGREQKWQQAIDGSISIEQLFEYQE